MTDEQELRQEEAAADAAASPVGDGEPAEAQAVEVDLDELQARAAQRDEYLALAQRTQADFENYRKRMTREVGAAEARGMAKIVKELLPALDNLERAIAAAEAEEDRAAAGHATEGASNDGDSGGGRTEHHLTKGIRLVQQDLSAALERVGIEAFSPQGETFDPTEHEAMASQPVEGAESGTVVEVYQQGYRLSGGTVIRPARVVVAA